MIILLKNKAINTLTKIQKYVGSDMFYVAKGSFWLIISQCAILISSFVLSLVFANLLPKDVFGNYRYIISLSGMLSIFILNGMNSAVVQAVSRGFDGILKKSILVQIKWGGIFSIASFIVGFYYLFNNNLTIFFSLITVSIFYPLSSAFNTYTAFLNGKRDFKKLAIYNIVSSLVITLVMTIIVILKGKVFMLSLAFFATNTIVNYYFYRKTIPFINEELSIDKEVESHIAYGKHLSFIGAISSIAQYIDGVLVFHYLGSTPLAIYSFATIVPDGLKNIIKIINPLSLPKFSKKNLQQFPDILRKTLIIFFIILIFILVYFFISPLIFKVLFPKYIDSLMYTRIYSFSLIGAATILPLSFLTGRSSKKEILTFNTVTSIFRIISLFIGVKYFGINGAAWSTVLFGLFSFILSIILLKISLLKTP